MRKKVKRLFNPCTTSLVAQTVKHLPTMWETRVRSLGREDLLEKEMATHSSILAWRIPWTEEPDTSQRVRHNWVTSLHFTSTLVNVPQTGKPQARGCVSFKKRQRNQRSNCQHLMDHRKSKRVPGKHLFLLYWLCQSLWLYLFAMKWWDFMPWS